MSLDGYRPGVVGQVVTLHVGYYVREWGFGLPFEAKVAAELSAFLAGFRDGADLFRAEFAPDGELLGTISVEAPGDREPLAHLRWFITADAARGTGLGRKLMAEAMAHVDAKRFPGTFLTTFAGLAPARHLYEAFGFRLVSESEIDQWSGGVREQRFERPRPE